MGKYNLDHIYVLTTGRCERTRLPHVVSELVRVGLISSEQDPILDIRYGLKPKAFRFLIDHTDAVEAGWLRGGDPITPQTSATLSHYLIFQEALERGFEKVMIIEDDESFINDTDVFDIMMKSVPTEADFILLDWMVIHHLNYFKSGAHKNFIQQCANQIKDGQKNHLFAQVPRFCSLGNSGCTIRTKKCMQGFIKLIESSWYPTNVPYADTFKAIDRWQDNFILEQFGIKTFVAVPQLAIQRDTQQAGGLGGKINRWYKDSLCPDILQMDLSNYHL